MDYPECYNLTFHGILVAFVELAFAYCLLCISAFIFITSKFLAYLPCPCSGIFGYQNRDLSIKKLFFDWPFSIILKTQKLTRIWHQEEKISVDKDKNLELMNKVRFLEEVVQEERLARSSLMVELEEERGASASAADEAMAMILRLQADKASLEMERKQYERMIEEKFAYDEEEMSILKEILIKREREKHFLEKELESYKNVDEGEDSEKIVYDVHVIEDDDDVVKKEEKGNDEMKEMKDVVKDHDTSSPSDSSSSVKVS